MNGKCISFHIRSIHADIIVYALKVERICE